MMKPYKVVKLTFRYIDMAGTKMTFNDKKSLNFIAICKVSTSHALAENIYDYSKHTIHNVMYDNCTIQHESLYDTY